MSEFIKELTKDNFHKEVSQCSLPVLVDFWGPKCGPCLGFMPIIEELANIYHDNIQFCKVNIALNRSLAIENKIMSIPTLQFYKNGQLVSVIHGTLSYEELEQQIQLLLQ